MTSAAPALRKSAWIPWVFVAGLGVVVAVNATLIVLSIGSFSGLVVPKPYERGVHYNQVLAAQAKQDALGWNLSTSIVRPEGARASDVTIVASDRDGRPLTGLSFVASLARPVEAITPLAVPLSEVAPGRYAASVELPKAGNWDLRMTAGRDGRIEFARVERMFVP